ncbi:MAG: protein-disulfide reductase DsbD [Gammaproteobacteria bacterium]
MSQSPLDSGLRRKDEKRIARGSLKNWLLAGLLALCPPALWAQFGLGEELLPPEEAFALEASASGDTLTARWTVADGYYLYRERIRFESSTPGIRLGTPDMPAGKVKEDEFFGTMETYRGDLLVTVPLVREAGAPDRLQLIVHHQGCADIGVCYPPQVENRELDLPQPASASPASSSPNRALQALSKLGDRLGLGGGGEDLLPPEQAFPFQASLAADGTLTARWDIPKGYYLYLDKIAFELPADADARFGTARLPAGEVKQDEFFGRVEVYHGGGEPLVVTVPLQPTGSAPVDTTATVRYQGCADLGVCYPPQTSSVPLRLAASDGSAPPPPAAAATTPPETVTDVPLSEQDRIARSLVEGNKLLVILTFFGFGLLLAFTPCVFPMIPILSSIIVGQGEHITTRRAFVLSLVYVLAMALTYTVAGVLAGLFGANLQAAFQNPWILGSFAAVFVLLSLSMFGFYELQIPQSMQSKLASLSNSQRSGTLIGVAIMGLLSALIVGPCVAAPLAGALIYIGQSGDPVLGGLALFAMSMGMGAPLLAIGTGTGKLLPRAGDWMNTIKAVFGVLLLAVAMWMLERILPAAIALGLWGLLLIVTSIYMGALDSMPPDATGWRRFWKGIGLALLVYGALLLVGAAAGSSDATQPLRGVVSSSAGVAGGGVEAKASFTTIKSLADVQTAVANASRQGRPVMLDFYADWCVDCKKLERYTFSDAQVQAKLENTLLLKADVTANDAVDRELMRHFGIIGPPAILFFDPSGEERREYRLVGFVDAADFSAHLGRMPFHQ